MNALLLSLILLAQAGATAQEPRVVAPAESAETRTIPIVITIEGADSLPASAGAQVPTVRLVSVNDAEAIETALSSENLSLTLKPASKQEYRVQVENLPEGYTVKSIAFGWKDLARETLKTMDLIASPPRIPTYTGRGELQALIDSIMEKPKLSITIVAPTK